MEWRCRGFVEEEDCGDGEAMKVMRSRGKSMRWSEDGEGEDIENERLWR